MRTGPLVLALIWSVPLVAWAAPPPAGPEASAAEISVALQEGRVGESLAAARKGIGDYPNEPVM